MRRLSGLTIILVLSGPAFAMPAASAQRPSATNAAFTEAQAALSHGRVAIALADVERGLNQSPKSITGLNLLGIILARQGKNQQALNAFKLALKANPQSVETLSNLGRFYLEQKEPELAEGALRAALKEAPANRDLNYDLGVVLLSEGRAQEAIDCFRRIQPPDSDTLFNMTGAYLKLGNTKEALVAAAILSEQSKGKVKIHFTLGVLLASYKQYEAAERQLEMADALEPGTFTIPFNLGEAYLRDGKRAQAELTLRRALTIQPDSVETLYLLAQAETADGKDVDALNLLVKAHHLAPRNTDIIFLMARVSMKQQYFQDAIPLLQQGLKIAPNRADLHAALGQCYFTVHKLDQALREFQTLVRLSPTATSYAFLGYYYRNLYKFDLAQKYFLLGLAKDPRNAVCLYNMGFMASRQGRYAEAETWLKKALAAKPDFTDALFDLARVNMAEKKYAEAIPLLRKCATLDREPAGDYYRLMVAERALHNLPAAERDMQIFQTLSKNPKAEPIPMEHVFQYLNAVQAMPPKQRSEVDLAEILAEVKRRPAEPRNYYMLAQAYLKLGQQDQAEKAIAQLDELSGDDARTAAGVGVLLARYQLYPEAIRHFELSLKANPDSDDVKYDLAVVYFRTLQYAEALSVLSQISPSGQNDESVLALLADTEAHAGRTDEATETYQEAIRESPDNDQSYLSLALVEMRAGKPDDARQTLTEGLARIPDSGKLFWGMGVLLAVEGKPQPAILDLRKSIDLLPEWAATYSALGFLYFETGQIEKSRETLDQISRNGLQAEFDVAKIEQVLALASRQPHSAQPELLSAQDRQQFLEFALTLADKTL